MHAQIPSPLTAEQELERKAKEAKKRNDQKKAKREKQKVSMSLVYYSQYCSFRLL